MLRLLEDLRRIDEELPLRDYGVFLYRKDGANCIRREYFDRKADAIAHAKALNIPSGMVIKVWQRTDEFGNRGFNKLIWSGCNEEFEELADSGIKFTKALMATNPITSLYFPNSKIIDSEVKRVADEVSYRAKRALGRLSSSLREKIRGRINGRH